MLEVKLTKYGVVDTLVDIRDELGEALGRKVSKYQKDAIICKAIGRVDTLYELLEVEDDKEE